LNGALVHDFTTKENFFINLINSKSMSEIISTIKSHDIPCIIHYITIYEYITLCQAKNECDIPDFIKVRLNPLNTHIVKNLSKAPKYNALAVWPYVFNTYENVKEIYHDFSKIPGVYVVMNEFDGKYEIDICSDSTNKGNSVEYLRNEYGYGHVIGFGDNFNDLPLFEACDIKVAVANAHPDVKAAADFICGTNETDGVVRWILEYLENRVK